MFDKRAATTAMKWLKCTSVTRQFCRQYNDCEGCPYHILSFDKSSESDYAEMVIEYIDALKEQTPAPSRWIPIDIEVPPEGVEVLVCTTRRTVTMAKRVRGGNRQNSYDHCEFIDERDRKVDVSYWMPKPLSVMPMLNDEGDLIKIREARRRLVEEYEKMVENRKIEGLD